MGTAARVLHHDPIGLSFEPDLTANLASPGKGGAEALLRNSPPAPPRHDGALGPVCDPRSIGKEFFRKADVVLPHIRVRLEPSPDQSRPDFVFVELNQLPALTAGQCFVRFHIDGVAERVCRLPGLIPDTWAATCHEQAMASQEGRPDAKGS